MRELALLLLALRGLLGEPLGALDEKLLTDFYRSRGYADFRVQGVAPEVTRERDAFYVTYNISEGPRYSFGRVDVVSEVPGVDPGP